MDAHRYLRILALISAVMPVLILGNSLQLAFELPAPSDIPPGSTEMQLNQDQIHLPGRDLGRDLNRSIQDLVQALRESEQHRHQEELARQELEKQLRDSQNAAQERASRLEEEKAREAMRLRGYAVLTALLVSVIVTLWLLWQLRAPVISKARVAALSTLVLGIVGLWLGILSKS